jgi:hypothetical protein
MDDPIRVLALGGFFGTMIAWSIIAPGHMSAVAEEPVKAVASVISDLFPESVDPKMFRKYDITFDDGVSTEVSRTRVVKKIAGGRTSDVTIVTTPSGTYSTDGLLSPNVQYPGIEKKLKSWSGSYWHFSSRSHGGGRWMSFSNGSIIYFSYRAGTRT